MMRHACISLIYETCTVIKPAEETYSIVPLLLGHINWKFREVILLVSLTYPSYMLETMEKDRHITRLVWTLPIE